MHDGGCSRFNQALEVWRCHTSQGFEGQYQCFVFYAGSNRKPVGGAEKGEDVRILAFFKDQTCCSILDQCTAHNPNSVYTAALNLHTQALSISTVIPKLVVGTPSVGPQMIYLYTMFFLTQQ